MLFCFKKGIKVSETVIEICSVYGEDRVSYSTVRRWYDKFKLGNFSLEAEQRCGRPSSLNENILVEIIAENPRLTVREIVDRLEMPKSTVYDC